MERARRNDSSKKVRSEFFMLRNNIKEPIIVFHLILVFIYTDEPKHYDQSQVNSDWVD